MKILRKIIFILFCAWHNALSESDSIKALIIDNAAAFNFHDEYGNVVGLDIDLINKIAKECNLSITYDTESLDNILTQIANHDGDLGLLPLSITEDRENKMLFSDAYVTAQLQCNCLCG